jgi:hypothetical protein
VSWILSPGFTWPPFPFATIVSISPFGFQPEVSYAFYSDAWPS